MPASHRQFSYFLVYRRKGELNFYSTLTTWQVLLNTISHLNLLMVKTWNLHSYYPSFTHEKHSQVHSLQNHRAASTHQCTMLIQLSLNTKLPLLGGLHLVLNILHYYFPFYRSFTELLNVWTILFIFNLYYFLVPATEVLKIYSQQIRRYKTVLRGRVVRGRKNYDRKSREETILRRPGALLVTQW